MFDGDLLAERARISPSRTALVLAETGERFTYADLHLRAARAAAAVLASGVSEGDRVGLLASNSIDFLAFFFGAGRAGAIVVPLSTRASAHELAQIAADCGLRVVFCSDDFTGVDGAQRVRLASINEHEPLAAIDDRDEEAIYCLLYTSGTTGKPKGVMIPKRQLLWNGYNTAVAWDLRADDVSPVFVPLCHAGGIAAFTIPIFTAGGTIVLHKGFDPATVWNVISRERCTVILGVPTIWKVLAESPQFATADTSSVRWVISGGAPLPAYLVEVYRERGITLKQGYGMTEVGVNCFVMDEDEAYAKAGSIGRPLPFTEVRLMNDDGREVADGEVGEMWIRGPHVSAGYWNNAEATRDAYLSGAPPPSAAPDDDERRRGRRRSTELWFRTGDLARRDPDGFFSIAGRRKEMFISGGFNVYPAEVESALLGHPGVRDAAVLAVQDDTWGESGVAFVVGDVAESDLLAHVSERLAKYKVPRRVVFVEALPRTPFGKVLKEELRLLLR